MPSNSETPHPPVVSLVTGHFRERANYASWRRHGTTDYLLMLALSGTGRVGYLGGEMAAKPGDLILLRPGTLHDYGTARGAAGWEIIWTHFLPRTHWLPDLRGWPESAPGLTLFSLGGPESETFVRARAALMEMHRLALSGLPRRDDFAMNALEEALLWCDLANPSRTAARLDERVQQALEFLRGRLSEPVSLAQVADAVGLSASRLGHLFREQTGQTPQQFVETARIARAQQLLSLTGRTVGVIAEEVGYENPFYFTLRFKKHTGLSPRDWRRQSGEGVPEGAETGSLE